MNSKKNLICRNCKGDHNTKECLEKPTKKKIKKSKELLHKVVNKENYEEKRDPFKNFDNDMYMEIVKAKQYNFESKIPVDEETPDVDQLEQKEPEIPEYTNFDPSGRTTSHSYRQREDVASYLQKKEDQDESANGDFVKAKGVEKLAWE